MLFFAFFFFFFNFETADRKQDRREFDAREKVRLFDPRFRDREDG